VYAVTDFLRISGCHPHWVRWQEPEWNRSLKGRQTHEQGHVDLVHKYYDGLNKSLTGKSKRKANQTLHEVGIALQKALMRTPSLPGAAKPKARNSTSNIK